MFVCAVWDLCMCVCRCMSVSVYLQEYSWMTFIILNLLCLVLGFYSQIRFDCGMLCDLCTWWSKPSPLKTFEMNWSNPLATICRMAMPTMHSTFLGVTVFSKFAKWNTTLVDISSVIYQKKQIKDTETEKILNREEYAVVIRDVYSTLFSECFEKLLENHPKFSQILNNCAQASDISVYWV